MGYNGRLLAKARARLAEIREENAAEQRRRLDEACAKLPGLRELDRGLRRQMIELSRLAMRPGAGSELEKLRAENLELQKKRAELLVSGGFPIDYTDEIYSCRLCRDSGLRGGEPCSCLKKLYNRQLTQELSSLLKKDAHVSRMTEQEISKCAEYLAARTAVAYPCYRCVHHITDINNIPVCAKHIERGNRCERFCASENFRSGTYNSDRSTTLG